ncbi:MAG: DUF4388 domain-containing protein [Holophagaceae bacterium]|nr:DUF4388 domain-containing protein [Holophagaceae bacterium]
MSQGVIQGSMREAPLPDIIQLVSQGGKSGCFHVQQEASKARIYLKDGRIIHAVTHAGEGFEALMEVALWIEGSYRFEEVVPDAEHHHQAQCFHPDGTWAPHGRMAGDQPEGAIGGPVPSLHPPAGRNTPRREPQGSPAPRRGHRVLHRGRAGGADAEARAHRRQGPLRPGDGWTCGDEGPPLRQAGEGGPPGQRARAGAHPRVHPAGHRAGLRTGDPGVQGGRDRHRASPGAPSGPADAGLSRER